MRITIVLTVLTVSACCHAQPATGAPPASDPPQVPLCMIGDSITWAGDGDWWRRYLIEEIPTLAFVGTHTARFGYSHAGEGGNRTWAVLARMEEIPDCANYHLMIGINDSASAASAEQVEDVAVGTAQRIAQIVEGLLAKPSCERIFLASILPGWQEEKPFRDVAGSRTNELLRAELEDGALADERIVWVEYERRIRPMDGWQQLMRIHPTVEGYAIVAAITAEAIREAAGLPEEIAAPVPAPGAGVRPEQVDGDGAAVVLRSVEDVEKPLELRLEVAPGDAGQRVTRPVFTGYEGYGYRQSHLRLEVEGAQISRILLEKMRPSGAASAYGTGSYLDTATPPAPGELLECPNED